MELQFPTDFLWGAASSAYQIEGHSTADGGGRSIWDTFSHTPGKIAWGDTGDVACDSYHRWEEDIGLLKNLGVKAYRFSTSWARIDPSGDGHWNEAGLAYYDKIVDGCLAAGITPYMTLYHWELPQALEDRGGWESRDTAEAFGRFAAMMAAHFKGRVCHYFTLNEPQCTVSLGYEQGIHAPGKALSQKRLFTCWKNQLLAHGFAQRAIHAADPRALVGIASTGRICYPEVETDENITAAREAMFDVSDRDWIFTHQMLLDPICLGRFPACPGTVLEKLIKKITAEEMAVIHTPPQILGYNIYNGSGIVSQYGRPVYAPRYAGFPRTALKWPVTPQVMDWGPRFLGERYGLPAYITENGLSCSDLVFLDGQVHDPQRIDFLTRYLAALQRAVHAGADIRGYFHWALTDNFEWHNGCSERFGLVYVDYPTGNRIPKDSYFWYQDLIQMKIKEALIKSARADSEGL